MQSELVDSIQGQFLALSAALTAVISSLPAEHAARAAIALAIDHESQRQEDQYADASPTAIRVRDMLVENYLKLCSAVAQRG